MGLAHHISRLIRAGRQLAEIQTGMPESLPSIQEVLDEASQAASQPGIPWPRERWIESFPEHRQVFDSLPDRVSREDVRSACAASPTSPAGAVEAFLAAMAWGHGESGYGVYRTRQILDSAGADAGPRLAAARSAAEDRGALAGYEQLGGASRMHGLGPAFGTKFLFFQNREALILDDLLARWFRGVTGVNLRPTVWNTNLYETYLTAMHDWAADANVEPASIEQAAFQLVSDGRGNQWAR